MVLRNLIVSLFELLKCNMEIEMLRMKEYIKEIPRFICCFFINSSVRTLLIHFILAKKSGSVTGDDEVQPATHNSTRK